ncbi:MAG: transposase, partial [Ruthenibacterium sp.]
RCQISNNLAENAIRPFTIGRKNWLFSDSVEGAKASAIIYSIVETAKANHLSPKDYLRVLLEMMPEWDVRQYPKNLEALLPWGEYIQEQFK